MWTGVAPHGATVPVTEPIGIEPMKYPMPFASLEAIYVTHDEIQWRTR